MPPEPAKYSLVHRTRPGKGQRGRAVNAGSEESGGTKKVGGLEGAVRAEALGISEHNAGRVLGGRGAGEQC